MLGTLFPKKSILVHCYDLSVLFSVSIFLVFLKCFNVSILRFNVYYCLVYMSKATVSSVSVKRGLRVFTLKI